MPGLTSNLLLNPATEVAVSNYLSTPSHALLISGQVSSGKSLLARAIAAELLGLESIDALDKYPYFRQVIKPADKNEIPIEAVRMAIASTRLKTTSSSHFSNIIFIEDAHLLTKDAQNALLKDLEEPPSGVAYILTSTTVHGVLPTISSRTQRITVNPTSLESANEFFGDTYDPAHIKSSWILSQGSIGLMQQLLASGDEHQLKMAVETIKQALSQPMYERLITIEKASEDKEKLEWLLLGAERVLAVLHHSAVTKNNTTNSTNFQAKRKNIQKLQKQLAANSNRRLISIRLALIL